LKKQQLILGIITTFVIISVSQPAQAFDVWGEIWGIVKNSSADIRRNTTGRVFDQHFVGALSEADIELFKAQSGEEWKNKVDDWCNEQVRNYRRSRNENAMSINGISSTWRHENQRYGCYDRRNVK
jgi:hypothetical protein